MKSHLNIRFVLGTLLLFVATAGAQPTSNPAPAGQDPAADLVRQGQQKAREGRHEEALAIFRQVLAKWPNSFPAHLQTGVVLDLKGQYAEARDHFAKAIELAPDAQNKAQALRAMAMSYAFERKCEDAAKYSSQVYEMHMVTKEFADAGAVANELARVCLESGDLDEAEKWYRRGYEAGLQELDLTPDARDLWQFRWEHAQARLAARRGNKVEAQKHVQAAKAIFEKGTNPNQAPFVPYLVGYVALYTGDPQTALTELQKGNQNDPFILSLIAQAYEKLDDHVKAREYYQRVLQSNAHNPTNAFARPLAKQKLAAK
ncbi:MAG: tetratricopeptide repeat protein [Acidobacteriota bacterium]